MILRWLPTFLGFPLGGLVSEFVAGPVDGLVPAVVGGAVTGAILGAVQAWGLALGRDEGARWAAATSAGLAVGLGAGAAAVGYDTDLADLTVMGAVCGTAVGAAQSVLLRPRLGSAALLWAPALGAAWAGGWAITTSIGVDVETQYTVFGSSGALAVTLVTAGLPALLGTREAAGSKA